MKIVTVVGARPQFIKAAIVSKAFASRGIKEVLIHSGQHYDENMSEVFFRELGMRKPNYNLNSGSGSHAQQTGKMLSAIEEVLVAESPDWVVVYGDTNTTLAAALSAAKINIPIAHVESGLRSHNRCMPEEINRVLTDHVSSLLFAPTRAAIQNLTKEGVSKKSIKLTGDVMYDAAIYYGKKAEKDSRILSALGICAEKYILATIHRAENTDSIARLSAIMRGISAVAKEIKVIMPLHPRTRRIIKNFGLDVSAIKIIDPVGYLDMVSLEKNAVGIVTDSGGVQKEAYFYRVPCITLRDETEWVELVEAGWNLLSPPASAKRVKEGILAGIRAKGKEGRFYGNGHASQIIADCFC